MPVCGRMRCEGGTSQREMYLMGWAALMYNTYKSCCDSRHRSHGSEGAVVTMLHHEVVLKSARFLEPGATDLTLSLIWTERHVVATAHLIRGLPDDYMLDANFTYCLPESLAVRWKDSMPKTTASGQQHNCYMPLSLIERQTRV